MKKFLLSFGMGALFAAPILVPHPLRAQSTPPVAPLVEADEPVVLNPFTVTTDKDRGYKATNATSGTRLNTPIKDAPLPIEVITNEFMRDTGSTDLRQALRYSAGILLQSQNDALNDPQGGQDREPGAGGANDPGGVTSRNTNTGFKLRGFVVDQVLRDGFRRQFSTDWINIDRVEVVRGPEALLYGVGSFGGVINFLPKRPEQKTKYYGSVGVGTDGYFRSEFDATGALGDGSVKGQPAYRVTGAWQRHQDHTDFFENNQYFISPVISFKPFKHTEVLIDNEFGIQHQNGVGFQNIRLSSPGSGAQQRGAVFWPDTNRVDQRTFRWSGPDTRLDTDYRNHVVDITQRVSDNLFFRVGANFNKVERKSLQVTNTAFAQSQFDPNDPLATGRAALLESFVPSVTLNDVFNRTVNPGFTIPPPRNSTLRYTWERREQDETRTQYRAEGTYNFELLGQHTLLVGAQSQYRKNTLDTEGYARTFANFNPSLQEQFSFHNPNELTPLRLGVQGDGRADPALIPLNLTVQQNWDLGYYAAYQGSFFDKRINLIAGYRWDRNDARSSRAERDQGTATVTDRSTLIPNAPSKWSPQIGVSFALTRDVSIYGLYSTGLIPNHDQQDGNGGLNPTSARNYEVGVKFDLLDGRVSGTVSAYEITRKNTPRNLWWAPAPFKDSTDPIDPAKPRAASWEFVGPENLWFAIKNTPNGLNVAKQIFPAGWHTYLERMAATPGGGNGNPNIPDFSSPSWGSWGDPTAPADAWNFEFGHLFGDATNNTLNPNTPATVFWPLVNLDLPTHEQFAITALESMGLITPGAQFGWAGNFFNQRNGQQLRFGDGTIGLRNIPHYTGAAVPINDRSRGIDAQVNLRPTDNLQLVLSYAYTEREIQTPTYQYVSTPYFLPVAQYYYPVFGWGTLDARPAAQAFGDVNDTSTFQVPIPENGQSLDDTPKHQASVWANYRFSAGRLNGLGAGLGVRYEGPRQYFSGFAVDGTANAVTVNGRQVFTQFTTKERYTVDLLLDYSTRWKDKYDVRFALNVNNLLDDQGRYGFVFAPGLVAKFTSSISF